MKSVMVIVLLVLGILVAVGCTKDNNESGKTAAQSASPVATATPDEFAAVRPIFKEHCEKCHGPTGEGGQVTVEGKKLRVPSFKAGHALKHTDEDFVEQVVNGGDGMPAFKGKFQPTEINGLVKFIRKEFQNK